MLPRILIIEHDSDAVTSEVDILKVLSCERVEEVNGERSLTIETLEELKREQRVLVEDENGAWREYVVSGVEAIHNGGSVTFRCYCPWSLMHDLEVSVVNRMPGVQRPVFARAAMEAALSGQTRWTLGDVEPVALAGASMYYMSGWEALSVVVENWGGEVEAEIEVDVSAGTVVSRTVSLRNQPTGQPVRRFEYGWDCEAITQTVADQPYPCRIIPRGKGEETESGGYGRRIDIADVNGGIEWLENPDTVPLVRMPDGNGGYEYPTAIVVFDFIEVPQDLKDYAQRHLAEYTSPRVTYDADLLAYVERGMDATGVKLGDLVQVIDSTFATEQSPDGLRIEARIVKMKVDMLDTRIAELEVGSLKPTLAGQFDGLRKSTFEVASGVEKIVEDLASQEWLVNLRMRSDSESPAVNLSPFFAHDLTDRSYWYNGQAVTNLLNATSYTADGWAHVSIPATSANTQYNIRITRSALEGVVPEGEDVTLLVELANVSTAGSIEGKLAQPSGMTGELVQLSDAQDVADGSHWFDGTATGTGGEGLCLQLWSGTAACELDVRVSLFKGKYRGAYKPYVVPEAELPGVLGLTVQSTTTAADIVTASSGFTCTAADFTTYGKVAMGTCTFRADANVAANAVAALGTLADGKRPAKLAGATLGAGTSVYGNAQVTNAGVIQLRPTAQIAAGTTFHVRFDYILA